MRLLRLCFFQSLAVLLICCITVFVSCKKEFLEIVPKGRLVAKATTDYDQLLNGNNLVTSNLSWDPQVALGDEMTAVEPYFSSAVARTQRLFRWADVVYDPTEEAGEISSLMQNIYTYNKVINEVMDSDGGTEAEKHRIAAEARAGRAWSYFLLINYYGKPYEAATASTDPGYPIVTVADVTQTNFQRASVQAVYDFILKDLSEAIYDLGGFTLRNRMSRKACQGLLGKVYVFMGNYTEALPLLTAAIAELGNSNQPVRLYDYNTTFGVGGSFLPITAVGPTYPLIASNEENLYSKQFLCTWSYTANELVLSAATVGLYKASDLRRKFLSPNPFQSTTVYPNGMLRKTGLLYVSAGITLPDLYLLSAECKARLGNLASAKEDLEALRRNRMPAVDVAIPASVASDGVQLVKYILEERIREFAGQGFRWFDMRRLSVDPIYKGTVGNPHTVYDFNTGGVLSTFSMKPERLTMRLPQMVMDQNPGMENNP